MNYTPDAKSLVYKELHFVSTSVARPVAVPSMDMIIDEVSLEIYEMFVGAPEVETVTAVVPGLIGIGLGSELGN